MLDPQEEHLRVSYLVLRYLKVTAEEGLLFKPGGDQSWRFMLIPLSWVQL